VSAALGSELSGRPAPPRARISVFGRHSGVRRGKIRGSAQRRSHRERRGASPMRPHRAQSSEPAPPQPNSALLPLLLLLLVSAARLVPPHVCGCAIGTSSATRQVRATTAPSPTPAPTRHEHDGPALLQIDSNRMTMPPQLLRRRRDRGPPLDLDHRSALDRCHRRRAHVIESSGTLGDMRWRRSTHTWSRSRDGELRVHRKPRHVTVGIRDPARDGPLGMGRFTARVMAAPCSCTS